MKIENVMTAEEETAEMLNAVADNSYILSAELTTHLCKTYPRSQIKVLMTACIMTAVKLFIFTVNSQNEKNLDEHYEEAFVKMCRHYFKLADKK